jgi:hypothetical protein
VCNPVGVEAPRYSQGAAVGEVSQSMSDIEAAREKVELAQKHIAYQRQRIVQHKKLIAQLKRDNKQNLLPGARELLRDLEHALAGMMVEQVRAQDELAKATTDQKAITDQKDLLVPDLANDFRTPNDPPFLTPTIGSRR